MILYLRCVLLCYAIAQSGKYKQQVETLTDVLHISCARFTLIALKVAHSNKNAYSLQQYTIHDN